MQQRDIQQPDILLDLPEIQFDMPIIPLKIDMSTIFFKPIKIHKFNFEANEALKSYHEQSETEKQLSPYRFWKKPDSLKERCVQFIAAQELEAGEKCERNDLPTHLYEKIDQSLEQANRQMASTKAMENINKRISEKTELFFASIRY